VGITSRICGGVNYAPRHPIISNYASTLSSPHNCITATRTQQFHPRYATPTKNSGDEGTRHADAIRSLGRERAAKTVISLLLPRCRVSALRPTLCLGAKFTGLPGSFASKLMVCRGPPAHLPPIPDVGSAWSLHTPVYGAPATLLSALIRLFFNSSCQEIAKRTWYTPLAPGQIGASITNFMARFGCRNNFTPVANGCQDQMLLQKFHAVAPMSACFPSAKFHTLARGTLWTILPISLLQPAWFI